MAVTKVFFKLRGHYGDAISCNPSIKIGGRYRSWAGVTSFVKTFGAYRAAGNSAPANTVLPIITGSGTNEPGTTLTVTPGTWTGQPVPTLTYQWKRGASEISGATSLTYVVQEVDREAAISCVETATNTQGEVDASSNSITIPAGLSNLTPPTIAGADSNPGTTLTVTPGTWAGTPAPTITHQWYRGATPIGGATGLTYVIQEADRTNAVICAETATSIQGQLTAISNAINVPAALAPPVNTIPVSIAGSGGSLPGTAMIATPGTWTGHPVPTLTYQWNRAGSPISGATGVTYVVQLADQGFAITCTETGTNTQGSASSTSNSISVPAALTAPVNTVAPTIAGANSNPGTTLTVTPGTWTGNPVPTLGYQWKRAGSAIPGATGLTYVIQLADQGFAITCTETGSNTEGSTSSTSNSISVPAALTAPVNTVAPTISGSTFTVGSTLTTTPGTWTGNPVPTITRQWKRAGSAIPGATNLTYVIQSADLGLLVTCDETGTNTQGSATAGSNAISIPVAPANTVMPVIAGSNLDVGRTITLTPGTWTGVPTPTITHQWYRDATPIPGATGLTYVIQEADQGYPVKCHENATNSAASVGVQSNTLNIWLDPANTFAPSIVFAGTPPIVVGSTLTLTPGTWLGVPTPTLTHQWRRDASTIAGATGLTYVVQAEDVGADISCIETATNSAGSLGVTSNFIAIPEWTPAELFLSGEEGLWLDSTDYSTMSQSRTSEVAVTGVGQPIGQWRNKILGQLKVANFVATSDTGRPVTRTTSGKQAVVYDGIDDMLISPDNGAVAGQALSVFFGQKTGAVDAGRRAYWGVTGTAVSIQNQTNGTMFVQALGRTVSSTEITSISSPNVIGLLASVGGTPLTVRVNGVSHPGSVPTAGTIGSNIRVVGDSQLYSEISQVVFINRVLTPTEISQLEAFIASKQ